MKPLVRALGALGAAALVAGGCGGSAEEGPSKSQYTARADRICATTLAASAPLVARVTAAGATSLTARRAKRLADVMRRLHALGVSYRERLRALEQPPGDGEQIDAFLTPTSQVVDAVGDGGATLARGDVMAALALLARARTLDEQAAAAARDYGFERCGSVIAAPA